MLQTANQPIFNSLTKLHYVDKSFLHTTEETRNARHVLQKLEEERNRHSKLSDNRNVSEILAKRKPQDARLKDLPHHIKFIETDDPRTQLQSTTYFRQLLSIERNPPIQQVIDSGVVPRLVSFLQCINNPHLQFEACWALTNIASGTSQHTQAIINAGAVPLFINLLDSLDPNVSEQAVWAIGNVAGDSPQCRDYILQCGAVPPLVSAVDRIGQLSMIRNAVWTMSNFCRGKPSPKFEHVKPLIAPLSRLLYSNDDEVLTDCTWAFSYLSDGPNERIQAVLEAGIARRVVELCLHHSHSVQTPALRVVGNIVTGDDLQTQIIINIGALPALITLMDSPKKSIRKEATWAISNITAGNHTQIQQVIDAGVIPKVIQKLMSDEFEIKKEATWALSNATSGGTKKQIEYLVTVGAIQPLCEILTCNDERIIVTALEGLNNILKVNPEPKSIIADTYLDAIVNLQDHSSETVYRLAVSLLSFFDTEEEFEVSNVAGASGGFNFDLKLRDPEEQKYNF